MIPFYFYSLLAFCFFLCCFHGTFICFLSFAFILLRSNSTCAYFHFNFTGSYFLMIYKWAVYSLPSHSFLLLFNVLLYPLGYYLFSFHCSLIPLLFCSNFISFHLYLFILVSTLFLRSDFIASIDFPLVPFPFHFHSISFQTYFQLVHSFSLH